MADKAPPAHIAHSKTESAAAPLAQHYNWLVAEAYTSAAFGSLPKTAQEKHQALPLRNIAAHVNRRSRRFFSEAPLNGKLLSDIRKWFADAASGTKWLELHIATVLVDGFEQPTVLPPDGSKTSGELKRISLTDLKACVNRMWWLSGSGACLFFVVDIERVIRSKGDHPRAYLSTLIDVGRVAQHVLCEASEAGLGGWMTPAINESIVKEKLDIQEINLEPVYFLRIGEPNMLVWNYEK